MMSGYSNSNRENFLKIKMEEQTVPSAGFSPQPEYMSADYYGVPATQQQHQQPAPPTLHPQPQTPTIGGGCLDSFDLSLLGDSYDDRDMATVPSPSSWSLLGALEEPNTWQQMSFYAASPQEQARAFSPDCIKPFVGGEAIQLGNQQNRSNNNNYSAAGGAAVPQIGGGGVSEMLHQLSSEDEMAVTCARNNILLRQCLEDNTFIEKYNFKPLDLPITALPNDNNGNNDAGVGAASGATVPSSPTLELNQIEPVFSLAYEQIISDIEATCRTLAISPDPMQWSVLDVQSWLCYSLTSFSPERATSVSSSPSLSAIRALWTIDGERLCSLTEEEFRQRDPIHGEKIFANLELLKMWKCSGVVEGANPMGSAAQNNNHSFDLGQMILASANLAGGDYLGRSNSGGNSPTDFVEDMKVDVEEAIQSPFTSPASVDTPTSSSASSASSVRHSDDDDDEDEEMDVKPSVVASTTPTSVGKAKPSGAKNGAHIHLWQFLKELLASGQQHGSCIRWLDQSRGVFKIEDSVRVARLWGIRKNRPAMNYDKLSRSIRQYYKKGIMRKTERSQRLVYQFCHPYGL